jgi:Zn-dependent protease
VGGPAAGGGPETRRRPSSIGGAIHLFTLAGIDVAVHASWVVIAALVTWSLATGFFPGALPRAGALEEWLLGAVTAILFFACVLAHELAHSLVARARGLNVQSITLFIFGGVSNLSGEARNPATEFQIAIVGPLTSFAIAAVAFLVATFVNGVPAVEAVASYLALINGALGVFNLVPGFPLDGGRVLRSIVWNATNDLRRATEVAAGAGQIVGWGLLLWGLWRVVNDDPFGGIWIGAIGLFLQNAASASLQQTVLEARLRRIRVGEVIGEAVPGVPRSTSVAELVEHFVLPGARRAVPVVDGGRVVGIVSLSDIARIPRERRDETSVADIMTAGDRLVSVTPATPLRKAVDLLASHEFEQLPVVEDGRLVGLLTRADVMRELQIREALDIRD